MVIKVIFKSGREVKLTVNTEDREVVFDMFSKHKFIKVGVPKLEGIINTAEVEQLLFVD